MARRSVPPLNCSFCGREFPATYIQWYHSQRGRKVYHSRDCFRAGQSVAKIKQTPIERFMSRVRILPNGCWEWTGSLGKDGYGQFSIGADLMFKAHRWIWEYYNGPIPDGLQIDHICHDPLVCRGGKNDLHRRCVFVLHMNLTTSKGNSAPERSLVSVVSRARFRAQTHCKRGHEFTPENTIIGKSGARICRQCRWMYNQEKSRLLSGFRAALRSWIKD